jgi:hypothetical protein
MNEQYVSNIIGTINGEHMDLNTGTEGLAPKIGIFATGDEHNRMCC